MSDYQHFNCTGNLVNDPKKYLVGEKNCVCHFRIASSAIKKEDNLYIDVVAWGSIAEVCYKYLNKGDKVLIAGPLQNDEWMSAGNQKQRTIKVKAHRVVFLRTREKRDQEAYGEEAKQ